MRFLVLGIIALSMVGCVSTDSLLGTYQIGYEDRDSQENRWSVEPGLDFITDNDGSVGISYRYREGEDTNNEEHGFFINGTVPLGTGQ